MANNNENSNPGMKNFEPINPSRQATQDPDQGSGKVDRSGDSTKDFIGDAETTRNAGRALGGSKGEK